MVDNDDALEGAFVSLYGLGMAMPQRNEEIAPINVSELLGHGCRTPLPAPSLSQAEADDLVAEVRRSRSRTTDPLRR